MSSNSMSIVTSTSMVDTTGEARNRSSDTDGASMSRNLSAVSELFATTVSCETTINTSFDAADVENDIASLRTAEDSKSLRSLALEIGQQRI